MAVMTMLHARRAFLPCAIATLVAVVGCSSNGHGSSGPSHGSVPAPSPIHTVVAGSGCKHPSPIMGKEVQGAGHQATLYGQVEAQLPVRVGEPVKIVWRMTGSGPLHLSTSSPHGTTIPLKWGPEAHASSNFDRPGDEWGAGYEFTIAGCWHLHAQRTVGSADVWLHVDPT